MEAASQASPRGASAGLRLGNGDTSQMPGFECSISGTLTRPSSNALVAVNSKISGTWSPAAT